MTHRPDYRVMVDRVGGGSGKESTIAVVGVGPTKLHGWARIRLVKNGEHRLVAFSENYSKKRVARKFKTSNSWAPLKM